ncbi:MAG: metallophosphoesterase [Bradyrhizobium sp.]|nr:MAG: metallophosphoesterase [Bradyrhizobium sp.]
MAKKSNAARRQTVLTQANLQAHHQSLPKSQHGHSFAPNKVPDKFHTLVDPDKNPPQPWRDLPVPPGLPPYRMNLDTIIDDATMATIRKSGKLVFHSVGDTGGVNTSTYIDGVTRFMECDFTLNANAADRPSFYYHLGDVVYYDGEGANYWPEFYEPYLQYPAPIVAIPGNHDGDVNPATGETSLQAFVRNFCSQSAVISQDNRDAPRRTMTQPNVFWTLNTPLVTIIGLYSNCPEGGQIGETQRQSFVFELKGAPASLPIILAVHHPIYSAYGSHPGSTRLKKFLEDSCTEAQRAPDVVLTGHVHDYQRFSAPLFNKKNVPFIIAGAGGYNKRLHVLGKVFQETKAANKLPVQIESEPELLENFNDSEHGYLRVTVTRKDITLDYVAVPDPSTSPKDAVLPPYDSVKVSLP